MSETADAERDAESALIELDVRAIRNALLRYRITAYVVGTLLVLLVCVAMPLKYFGPKNGALVTYTGIPHGWLFMVLIITVYDLGRRIHWPLKRMLMIVVSGLLPFLTFVAEHYATKNVRQYLADVEAGRINPLD